MKSHSLFTFQLLLLLAKPATAEDEEASSAGWGTVFFLFLFSLVCYFCYKERRKHQIEKDGIEEPIPDDVVEWMFFGYLTSTGFPDDTKEKPQPLRLKLKNLENQEEKKEMLTPASLKRELVRMLADKDAYGMPGTNGNLLSCWVASIKEEHLIISLFTHHPLHPYVKRNRLLFLWNSLTWMLFVGAVFQAIGEESATHPTVTAVLISLFTVPYNFLMRTLLDCGCCVHCPVLETAGKCLGKSMAWFLTVCSVLWLVFGIVFSVRIGPAFLPTWIQSQIFGWIQGIFIMMFFSWYFRGRGEKTFKKRWCEYFENEPVSISDVARFVRDRDVTASQIGSIKEWNELFFLGCGNYAQPALRSSEQKCAQPALQSSAADNILDATPKNGIELKSSSGVASQSLQKCNSAAVSEGAAKVEHHAEENVVSGTANDHERKDERDAGEKEDKQGGERVQDKVAV